MTRSTRVKVEIYTTSGRLVKRYPEGTLLDAGYNEIPEGSTWDGMDDGNQALANGVYFYKITAISELGSAVTETGKLVILK